MSEAVHRPEAFLPGPRWSLIGSVVSDRVAAPKATVSGEDGMRRNDTRTNTVPVGGPWAFFVYSATAMNTTPRELWVREDFSRTGRFRHTTTCAVEVVDAEGGVL